MSDLTPFQLAERVLELDKAEESRPWRYEHSIEDIDTLEGGDTYEVVSIFDGPNDPEDCILYSQNCDKADAELIVFLRNNAKALATAVIEAEKERGSTERQHLALREKFVATFDELLEAQKRIAELEETLRDYA